MTLMPGSEQMLIQVGAVAVIVLIIIAIAYFVVPFFFKKKGKSKK